MKLLLEYIIFPGFFFSATCGLLAGWVDRKVSARLQWRVGPPWHQNFTDIIKLCGKEIIIPQGAGPVFLLAPYFALLSAVLASTILGLAVISPLGGFTGDLIVILYLLTMPAIAVLMGAGASANPMASLGASREMKSILAYELPFLLSVITVIIKNAGSIQLGNILNNQVNYASLIFSYSGILAFLAAIFCIQAKLCLGPFDASEAEQEIMSGVFIEYSGLPLAVFKLARAIMFYTMPLLLIVLFWGKDLSAPALIGKYTVILVIMILVKNTNPRLRIDQLMRFFWGPVTLLALVSAGLAVFGY